MPIIDSISGAFHDIYPVGRIYRFVLFLYMLFFLAKDYGKQFLEVVVSLSLFMITQILVSSSYVTESLQYLMKLFIPIVSIILFFKLLEVNKMDKKSIFGLLDRWSVLYPSLIIIPGILGIGINAYDGSVGWKGFFYATNEISFILSSLVMYLFWKLSKELNLKTIVILVMNCMCIILMGTKTGYATIGVFFVLFIINSFSKKSLKRIIKVIIFLLMGLFLLTALRFRIIELTASIFERWIYQRGYSYSTIDFLLSMRLRRFEGAMDTFLNGLYIPFGWGLGGEYAGLHNMEMDFLDLLFRCGIIGCLYVCVFYFRKIKSVCNKNKWGFFILIWSIALSFGAGHVLFYGQSGMMLGILYVLSKTIQICSHEKTKN